MAISTKYVMPKVGFLASDVRLLEGLSITREVHPFAFTFTISRTIILLPTDQPSWHLFCSPSSPIVSIASISSKLAFKLPSPMTNHYQDQPAPSEPLDQLTKTQPIIRQHPRHGRLQLPLQLLVLQVPLQSRPPLALRACHPSSEAADCHGWMMIATGG